MSQTDGNETPVHLDDDTEFVVEYRSTSRTRLALVAIIVILVLLLGVLGWVIVSTMRPIGAPAQADLPEGLSWVRSIYAWGPTPAERLRSPIDVAVAPDGLVWASTNTSLLVGFTPDGELERVIEAPFGPDSGQAISYEGIDVDEAGNIYVCDYGRNAIVVYSSDGVLLNEWGVQLPREIAVRDGRVAVAAANGIAVFDEDGDLIAQWGQRGSGEADVDLPHGIAIDEAGNIYVADTQNTRVKAYSPDGRLLWIKESTPDDPAVSGSEGETETAPVAGEVSQRLQVPVGMTIDGAGRIVMADAFEFQLLVLDALGDGEIIGRYGDFGATDGMFTYPTGVDYDANRDWFVVADTTNDRLQIVRIPGSGGSAVVRLVSRAGDTALWLCSIPLALLLLALVLAARRRRRDRDSGSVAQVRDAGTNFANDSSVM